MMMEIGRTWNRFQHSVYRIGFIRDGLSDIFTAVQRVSGVFNRFLEFCGSFCSTRLWEDTLRIVPADRIVYGTDAAAHGIDWELGRLLSVDAPESTIEQILGRNMRDILARRQ